MKFLLKIKLHLTHIIARLAYPDAVRIVVASNGRTASTMLAYAIASGIIHHKYRIEYSSILNTFISKFVREFNPRISTINRWSAYVCKTHDLFDVPHNVKCNYIFVHGEPLESAMSVEKYVLKKGLSWFARHQHHLKASGDYDELFEKDILNYEGQIKSWMSKENKNYVLCLAYEELWDKVNEISDFLGFEVKLPEQRSRIRKEIPDKLNENLFNELNILRNKYFKANKKN